MTVVDNYRHTHITLLDRSLNCTDGNTWIWNYVAQCLEHVHHVIGFASGLLAILLCAAAYTSLSLVRARDHSHKSHIRLSAVMYWLSEVTSLFGAILSHQLPTQILYSITIVPVYSLCCTFAFIKTSNRNQKQYRAKSDKRDKKSLIGKCMYPLYVLLPAVLYMSCGESVVKATARNDELFESDHTEAEIGLPVYRLLGYILGIMAGVLLGCVRIVEILHVYTSFESHRCFPLVYITGITGSACYIFSVTSQSMSSTYMYHASPWTIPRLVTIGMDFGILVQRLLQQHRWSKQRRLSDEGARSLISSGTDDGSSGSDSEEVIWMPLKIVETVQPQNSPNIQILTVSESSFDSQDIQRPVPDMKFVPGQADFTHEHSGHSEREDGADNVDNIRAGVDDGGDGIGDIAYCETGLNNGHDYKDCGGSTEHILDRECRQDNDISDTSTSSLDSYSTIDTRPLTANNNCTKDTIATLGTVTTVEKIHTWISTSN